jgi:hypothetical protein
MDVVAHVPFENEASLLATGGSEGEAELAEKVGELTILGKLRLIGV